MGQRTTEESTPRPYFQVCPVSHGGPHQNQTTADPGAPSPPIRTRGIFSARPASVS